MDISGPNSLIPAQKRMNPGWGGNRANSGRKKKKPNDSSDEPRSLLSSSRVIRSHSTANTSSSSQNSHLVDASPAAPSPSSHIPAVGFFAPKTRGRAVASVVSEANVPTASRTTDLTDTANEDMSNNTRDRECKFPTSYCS